MGIRQVPSAVGVARPRQRSLIFSPSLTSVLHLPFLLHYVYWSLTAPYLSFRVVFSLIDKPLFIPNKKNTTSQNQLCFMATMHCMQALR